MDIRPDVIIGDLDSISPSTKLIYKRIPLLPIPSQETTDLEKAVRYCLEHRCNSVDIIGAFGNRIDHAIGALGIFKKFGRKTIITFIDGVGKLTLVVRRIRLHMKVGQQLSLIPLEKTTGITTRNLKYPLKNETLEIGVREGTSNEATAANVTVSLRRGTLLLYQFHLR